MGFSRLVLEWFGMPGGNDGPAHPKDVPGIPGMQKRENPDPEEAPGCIPRAFPTRFPLHPGWGRKIIPGQENYPGWGRKIISGQEDHSRARKSSWKGQENHPREGK